jgi:hypothetical protein
MNTIRSRKILAFPRPKVKSYWVPPP